MTQVTQTNSYNSADADDVTTVFNFTFFAYTTDDIKVYSVLNDELTPITTGITINLNSSFVGGNVTFAVAPADAVGDILIRREVSYTQQTEFTDITRYKETAIETALNTLALQIQQLSANQDLTAKYTEVSGVTDVVIETPEDGKVLVFDGTTGRIKAGPTTDNLDTLAGITSEIATVAGIAANVTTVAGISSNVTTVAGIAANVTTVAGISASVTTVAGISADVATVAANDTDISTVASNISDVNAFANIYRIASSDPVTSLDEGDLVYNTTDNALKYYNGSSWVAIAPGIGSVQDDTSPVLGGNLDVDVNSIVSSSNGDITLEPNGTGSINLNAADVFVEEDIVHTGDVDNKITFGTDTQDYQTGGSSRMDLSDSGVRFGGANARVTTVLDEDDLTSDSATALATQQSIKAYVDTQVASAGGDTSFNYFDAYHNVSHGGYELTVTASSSGSQGPVSGVTSGTNSSIQTGAGKLGHEMSTGTTSSGQARAWIKGPHHYSAETPQINPSDYTFSAKCIVSFVDLSDGTNGYNFRFGLDSSNNGLNGNPSDAIYVEYEDSENSGKFQCHTVDASTDTNTDSGITVAADTLYELEIRGNAAGDEITFYINGSLVATNTTNIPDVEDMNFTISQITKTSGTSGRRCFTSMLQANSPRT